MSSSKVVLMLILSTITVTMGVPIQCGGSSTIQVDDSSTIQVDDPSTIQVDDSSTIQVDDPSTIQSDDSSTIQVDDPSTVAANATESTPLPTLGYCDFDTYLADQIVFPYGDSGATVVTTQYISDECDCSPNSAWRFTKGEPNVSTLAATFVCSAQPFCACDLHGNCYTSNNLASESSAELYTVFGGFFYESYLLPKSSSGAAASVSNGPVTYSDRKFDGTLYTPADILANPLAFLRVGSLRCGVCSSDDLVCQPSH